MATSMDWLLPSHDVLTATMWIGAGAVVAAFITARNAKLVKLSEHRQNWINALRDDVSKYITKAGEIRDHTNDLRIEPDAQRQTALREIIAEKISKANVLRLKILLRLNLDENDHIELARLLNAMQRVEQFEQQPGLEDRATVQARRVLRREWAVTKYGIWADLRLWLKRTRQQCWRWVRQRSKAVFIRWVP
jgi:hypothetical protein